jgi:serine/threonine protein kinase
MKLVRGITLLKILELLTERQPGTLAKYPLGQLLTVFQKVCDAVAFAHSKEVIHRDLKPENIMIGDFGEVLVMDWGLAKVLDPERIKLRAGVEGQSIIRTGVRKDLAEAETASGEVRGTPQYTAPEQAHGAHQMLDARTDLYALGAILYHILALRPPSIDPTRRRFCAKSPAASSSHRSRRLVGNRSRICRMAASRRRSPRPR